MSPSAKRPTRSEAPATDAGGDDEIFDVDRVRKLVELMKEHDLSEVELRGGARRIRLRRGAAPMAPSYMVASAPPPAPPMAAAPAAAGEKTAPASSAAEGANIALIKSPMVGTFYSRPNPNAAPFVKPGDHVNPDTTVCIIEAMKVFNEIPAEARGRVVAVLVSDGEAVDHGKPLFKIDTAS